MRITAIATAHVLNVSIHDAYGVFKQLTRKKSKNALETKKLIQREIMRIGKWFPNSRVTDKVKRKRKTKTPFERRTRK